MSLRHQVKPIKDIVRDNCKPQSHDVDDEETLSLRDLPITVDLRHATTNLSRPSSSCSSNSSSFEFLANTTDSTASTADDVIIDGHILPYAPPPPLLPRRSLSLSCDLPRSQSKSDSTPTRSSSAAIRSSRSLNCQKLRRNGAKMEEASSLYSRSSSTSSRCRNNNNEIIKLPWHNCLILGLPVKIPAEIELKDIKHRQSRRTNHPSRFLPSDRRSNSSASWRILSILSCKSHSSIDVINTPPIFP